MNINFSNYFNKKKNIDYCNFIAIGDIHGSLEKLLEILNKASKTIQENNLSADDVTFIFLGDYIDRGPKSKNVIEYLSKFRSKAIFLRGNHEQVLLDFFKNPDENKNWINYGGYETMLSYGVNCLKLLNNGKSLKEISEIFKDVFPPHHFEFIKNTQFFFETDRFFFAHAGVNPEYDLHKQSENDLMWIREDFLKSKKKFKKIIVHGHTPHEDPYIDKRRICIDTGVYLEEGKLSSFVNLNGKMEFISV